MTAKLIIEEVPVTAKETEIHEFFSAMGSVIAINKFQSHEKNQSWVVEMSTFEEANGVLEHLDDVLNIRLAG